MTARGARSVIIVGGGLAGVTTAYALARRGVAVTLFEARAAPGLETSYANGALLTPSMPDPWNGPGVWRHLAKSLFNPDASMLLRPRAIPSLTRWGVQFLANSSTNRFAAATRANFLLCDFSTRMTAAWWYAEKLEFDGAAVGTLKIFRTAAAMEGPLAIARSLQPLGLSFETLDAAQTIAAETALEPIADRIAGSIRYPDDLRGDAHRFTQALAQKAAALGATLHFGRRIARIIRRGTRATGVEADGDRFEADGVIVAAANASRALVAPLGLRLPVRPAKGYSLTFDCAGMNDAPRLAVVDDAMHAAVVPVGQRLRVAGTAEFAGEDLTIDPKRIDNLRRLLNEVYPAIAERFDSASGVGWTGLRPMSADGRPFIGKTRVDGLWLNCGHGHLGWTMAAGSAELLAAELLAEPPPIAAEPYRADRI